ncbi:N-6 DNA methylase [Paracoccus seriniphilus]|uniref:N-6 DNA methylase n=1 Tax=Paracoccus seriniphilus TaxID=184748 RepID=UPI0027A4D565|nr:N-6 DNA methylase [Paracoccus seriniphilus]
MFTAQLGSRNAAFHLAQHAHDLGFCETCLLHRYLLVHPAEKILLPQPPKIGGDYPDDVLFINAAEHYQPGKRQNTLLQEHINKIVETYQHRKEEDRYSQVVSLDEIEKEHDFNLNISRYVSTAEPEEEVDLVSVHKHLSDLQTQISSAAATHNRYLKELGITPLPLGFEKATD